MYRPSASEPATMPFPANVKLTIVRPPSTRDVALKLTLPTRPGLYEPLASHPRVVRILALSGGYSRNEACQRLATSPGMIASFSRALLEDLRADMSAAAFDAALAGAIDQIYRASVEKAGA